MKLSIHMRRLALGAHLLLIALVAARNPSVLSLIVAAPLLLPLAGMWRARTYTFAWASMLVAFYVAGFLAEGYARPETRAVSFSVASIAALDYVCLMLFVRFTAREKAATAAPAPAARTGASDDAAR